MTWWSLPKKGSKKLQRTVGSTTALSIGWTRSRAGVDGVCDFGANAAKTGGYCGSRLLTPTASMPFPPLTWHPALNCSLDDPDAQLYATPTSVSTCCQLCRTKINVSSVGAVTVMDIQARFNNAYLESNRSGIERSNGVSVWFLVAFGGVCVLLGIGALHLYIMLKHGWQKAKKVSVQSIACCSA